MTQLAWTLRLSGSQTPGTSRISDSLKSTWCLSLHFCCKNQDEKAAEKQAQDSNAEVRARENTQEQKI